MSGSLFTRIGSSAAIWILCAALVLSGCDDRVVLPSPVVSVSPSIARVPVGQVEALTAQVTNDLRHGGVTWSLSGSGCSGAACGSLSASSSASGQAISYTAPSAVPTPATVTVTASSVNDHTSSGVARITITPPPVAVVLTGPGAVDLNTQQAFKDTVYNDPSNSGVTWTLSGPGCAGAACGTLSANRSASGAQVIYTAPSAVPNPNYVLITATSVGDPTQSTTQTVTITSLIAVSVTPTSANLNVSGPLQLTATLTNDALNAGVIWALECQTTTCGTLSSSSSSSGVAVTYTAPFMVPLGGTVTIRAASVTDYTKSASATIIITSTVSFVTISPALAGVDVGTSRAFTATVADDPSNLGVTWALSGLGCSGPACGTLSATRSASGAAVTYTAPATAPSPAAVTLTATSVTDYTKVATATVIVTTPGVVSVALSPVAPSLNLGAQQQLTATTFNDPGNAGVTWSVTGPGCSGSACGTIAPTSSASGATVTYTAPGVVPNPATVIISGTSVTDPTKLASDTVVITSLIQVSLTPAGFIGVNLGTTQQFSATIANDPGNLGVTWAFAGGCDPSVCGSITTAGLYTAPATLPAGFTSGTVVVTVTSVADYTKGASATIVITTPGVIAVVVSPANATVRSGATRSFTAYVFNDLGNAGVTWTASSGIISPTSSASGVAVTYRAPFHSGITVTLRATSVTDPGKSGSAIVTVSPVICGILCR